MYLYASNLYGWAMSQCLPTGSFRWKKNTNIDLAKYAANCPKGLILEVDLEYSITGTYNCIWSSV